jgi:hypothetical protein
MMFMITMPPTTIEIETTPNATAAIIPKIAWTKLLIASEVKTPKVSLSL